MARLKASQGGERRTSFVGTNLYPSEREEVVRRAFAARRKISEHVRLVLLSTGHVRTPTLRMSDEVGRELLYQLKKIGNNLNQLAHIAQATKSLPEGWALLATIDELAHATRALIEQ